MTNIPQAMESPVPLREFIVSPGFAGVAAVVAALIVLCAVLFSVRRAGKRLDRELEQRERHHHDAREGEQNALASRHCWETLKWLVKTAGLEPAASEGATLGLGPELAMATLRGLLRDAERLGDETLADAVTVYQNQFALVLAQPHPTFIHRYRATQKAHAWSVWPHSRSRGWLEKITQPIPP